MAERYFEGGWHRDMGLRGFQYVAPGMYDESTWTQRADKVLSDQEARQLIPVLEAHGFLLPRLDERLRVEDLKITHRLLDLLEKMA